MPSRQPSASPPGSQSWLPALPPGFQTPVVEFAREPFARLTYAYPSRRPATVDLGVLPAPMRQEVAYWLHTLAVAGERVNSWALAEWVRVAAAVAAGQDLCSFTGLSVEEWMAAARRRYHDRHRRLPPESYLHNHRATIARLHDALMLACQAGEPWWRSQVWDPRHDRRIPVRRHEPLEGQRLNFARVSPAWLREAIQWYFASGLTTGLPELPRPPLRRVPGHRGTRHPGPGRRYRNRAAPGGDAAAGLPAPADHPRRPPARPVHRRPGADHGGRVLRLHGRPARRRRQGAGRAAVGRPVRRPRPLVAAR